MIFEMDTAAGSWQSHTLQTTLSHALCRDALLEAGVQCFRSTKHDMSGCAKYTIADQPALLPMP